MGVSARAGTGAGKPHQVVRPRVMGVVVHPCHANYHIQGVCRHPGSKRDLRKATERRRAKNKMAAKSRRINRAGH